MNRIGISQKALGQLFLKHKSVPRLELALGNAGTEIGAPEYRRVIPRWSKAQYGVAHNIDPIEFPVAESDWGEINFIVVVAAGTSDAVGSARLTPTVIAPGNRLIFAPGELETVIV